MTDSDRSTADEAAQRRTIQRQTDLTAAGAGDGALDGAGEAARRGAARRLAGATDSSRRAFLASLGAGVAASGLGLGTGTAAADHDERPMPEEFSDRGIPTPRLHRDGNLIKDPDGNTVKLRGVNVTDPARAQSLLWRSPLWQNIARATDPERDWYSRIIRIPCQTGDIANVSADDGSIMGSPTDEVEPGSFSREQLEAYVENYLRPAVDFCERMGVYCIVDYHRHDDQQIRYDSEDVHEELMLFWDVVAPEFADDTHVLYEVYNEPIGPYVGEAQDVDAGVHDDVAEETWLNWREAAQPWVDKIREHAAETIVIIGSPRWTQWTWWAAEHEFEGENLAYAGHVYTHENLRPLERYFGEPAEEVPVFMSEFGWTTGSNADFLNGTPEEHGQEFREFMESKDSIHWQAWAFDAWWQPTMFDFDDSTHEWSLLGDPYQGEFVRDWLKETRNDLIPGTGGDEHTPEDCSDTAGGSADVDGQTVCDVDGDGYYRDVTGDGTVGQTDVVHFFERQHRSAWKQPSMFDFTENGAVGHGDVVDLFEYVAKQS